MIEARNAKFAKRHYEIIAAVFKEQKPGDNWDANKRVQHNLLLASFDAMFRRDNPNYRSDQFIKAAGGQCP